MNVKRENNLPSQEKSDSEGPTKKTKEYSKVEAPALSVYLSTRVYRYVSNVSEDFSSKESQIDITSTKLRRTHAEPKECSVLDKDRTILEIVPEGPTRIVATLDNVGA